MANIDLTKEIIFSSSDAVASRQISRAEKSGKLRKIAPRIYTTNLLDSPEYIVKRNLLDILAWRFPNAVISHRSAHELRPTDTGDFFLTSTSNQRVTDIPGIHINVTKGHPALPNDIAMGSLTIYVASEPRWMLEMMQTSRKKGGESKSLPTAWIEERLEKMVHAGGEARLNAFRDSCREVSRQIGLEKEFEKLNRKVGAPGISCVYPVPSSAKFHISRANG